MAMAGVGERINMAGTVYEEQVWRCIDIKFICTNSSSLSARVRNIGPQKIEQTNFFSRSFLTADRFLASLVALFGEYDISGELESKRSVSKNVKRVVVHRQYDAATFENDLALLELESPIHYDAHIGK
jgi:hypothetical protein